MVRKEGCVVAVAAIAVHDEQNNLCGADGVEQGKYCVRTVLSEPITQNMFHSHR